MVATAAPAGRKLSFQDTQLILTAVKPNPGSVELQSTETAMKYILGLDPNLAADLKNSPNQDLIFNTARQVYGKMSAYTTLQGMVL